MTRRAAGVALVLVLSGCGGGRLTRSEYVYRADSICQRYNEAIATLPRPHDLASFASFADRTLHELDHVIDEERALQPPLRLVRLERRWLAQAARIRADTIAVRDAARRGDGAATRLQILRGERDDARGNALARKLGLRVCSKP